MNRTKRKELNWINKEYKYKKNLKLLMSKENNSSRIQNYNYSG